MKPKRHNYTFTLAQPQDKHRTDLVTIWQHPEDDTKYTVGLDAATGFGSDYTSIQVWSNRLPFEQVAWLRNKRTTTVVGSEVMVALARYYNNAFIVPETRYPGNAYVDNAIEKYGYGYIYQKMQSLDEAPSVSSKYGICTTETDKHILINSFKELTEDIDGSRIKPHDETTIYEFCNFVYIDDKRKTGAGKGFHDDTVIAAMLALCYGCSVHPQKPREVKQEYTIEDEDRAQHLYLMKLDNQRFQEKKGMIVV